MKQTLLKIFEERGTLSGAVSTLLLLVGVVLVRWFVARAIRGSALSPEERRRYLVMARNVSILAFLFSTVVIWASELRTIALSMVAVAAAIVIATKELILCLSGGILRSTSGSFSVGDRIELNGLRGDVIDLSLLTTTILEIGPGQMTHQHTGRAISLPNALLLSAPVVNESFTEQYVLHTITVPIGTDQKYKEARVVLLNTAKEICEEHIEEAQRHFASFGQEYGLSSPNPEPRVTIQMPAPKRVNLVLRIPAPAQSKGRIEQDILNRFVERFDLSTPPELLARP